MTPISFANFCSPSKEPWLKDLSSIVPRSVIKYRELSSHLISPAAALLSEAAWLVCAALSSEAFVLSEDFASFLFPQAARTKTSASNAPKIFQLFFIVSSLCSSVSSTFTRPMCNYYTSLTGNTLFLKNYRCPLSKGRPSAAGARVFLLVNVNSTIVIT